MRHVTLVVVEGSWTLWLSIRAPRSQFRDRQAILTNGLSNLRFYHHCAIDSDKPRSAFFPCAFSSLFHSSWLQHVATF